MLERASKANLNKYPAYRVPQGPHLESIELETGRVQVPIDPHFFRLAPWATLYFVFLTFWTRRTYYYVMDIDAVPRRSYYYVLDLHGFNSPAQISVVHHWTPTWTRGLGMSHCALRRKKFVASTSEAEVLNAWKNTNGCERSFLELLENRS